MNLLIRQWTLKDLPAVQRVTWTTWLDAYSSFIPESDLKSYFDSHYTLEALSALVQPPAKSGFVALIDDEVVGYAKTLFNGEEERFYVSSLYILPGHQGKGIGGRLMAAAEEHARSFGVESVWLGVMTQNIQALEWYKKMGFEFLEEAPFTMGNTTVTHLIGCRKIRTEAKPKS